MVMEEAEHAGLKGQFQDVGQCPPFFPSLKLSSKSLIEVGQFL